MLNHAQISQSDDPQRNQATLVVGFQVFVNSWLCLVTRPGQLS